MLPFRVRTSPPYPGCSFLWPTIFRCVWAKSPSWAEKHYWLSLSRGPPASSSLLLLLRSERFVLGHANILLRRAPGCSNGNGVNVDDSIKVKYNSKRKLYSTRHLCDFFFGAGGSSAATIAYTNAQSVSPARLHSKEGGGRV